MAQKHLVCNYCGFKQYTENNPKVCPRCHNPYNKIPKNGTRRIYNEN